jgi:hypothetical protein
MRKRGLCGVFVDMRDGDAIKQGCSNIEESQMSLLDAAPGHGAPLLRTSHAQTGSRGMLSLLFGEMARWRR